MLARRLAGLLVGALALTAACTAAPAPDRAAPSGTPPVADEPSPEPHTPLAVHALTSAELQSRWWDWATSVAEERNPVTDQDGHLCGQGQRDDVWFLAGTTGGAVTRTCNVPVGLPIAFPLVNLFGESSDCLEFMDSAQGSATLDGRELTAEALGSTPIRMYPQEGNPFTSGEGSVNTHSCGLWVRLDPLDPGSHELTLRGRSGAFTTSVDYHLKVARPVPTNAA
ncbi:signal protein [Kitasatospora sp. NPDC048538]|uniref:signal protein n=1 Tax=unclassified Kitasatospora TaxID=2633591 RepID=UPI0033E92BE5